MISHKQASSNGFFPPKTPPSSAFIAEKKNYLHPSQTQYVVKCAQKHKGQLLHLTFEKGPASDSKTGKVKIRV